MLYSATVSSLNSVAFPTESTGVRHVPSDLYEPSDELRKLGLPVLDWSSPASNVKWKPGSDEGATVVRIFDTFYPPKFTRIMSALWLTIPHVYTACIINSHVCSQALVRSWPSSTSDHRCASPARVYYDLFPFHPRGFTRIPLQSLPRILPPYLSSLGIPQARILTVHQARRLGVSRKPTRGLPQPRLRSLGVFGCQQWCEGFGPGQAQGRSRSTWLRSCGSSH